MILSDRVLGSTTTRTLRDRTAAPVLRIGADTFTRHDLAAIDCFNFLAAANLSALLTEHLRVKDTRDLYNNTPPSALAVPRLGAIALATLGAAFEVKGLGGAAPLESWVNKHATDKAAPLVTFYTLKHRDEAERAAERKQLKARKAARRDKAHRTRVDRFTERHPEVSP